MTNHLLSYYNGRMIKTNRDQLVCISVSGEIQSPLSGSTPYYLSFDGRPFNEFMTGGIVYNVRVGDSAFGWAGDHVEPCVTLRNPDDQANHALNILACVGNQARVLTGDAKGAQGAVTGKHGGGEKVLVDFPASQLEQMAIGDRIQVKAFGCGLRFLDHPEVMALNLGVELAEQMGLEDGPDGGLVVPVAAVVPAHLMGSGSGAAAARGDYDITTADRAALAAAGCDHIRLGDIVAIQDHDSRFGKGCYRAGFVSIGVVIHGDSVIGGHGPGVTLLLGGEQGSLRPRLDEHANLADFLLIGRNRR